jgi:hypothetical protein
MMTKNRYLIYFFLAGIILLFIPLLFVQGKLASSSIIACNALILGSFIYNYRSTLRFGEYYNGIVFNKSVLLQIVAQLIIFLYWGLFNPVVFERFPLIIHQVTYAYWLQVFLSLRYNKKFTFSYSNAAAVLSTNLFVWFDPKVYFFHIILILIALLAKMFLTREIGGVRKHIFNPSGLVSFIATIFISLAWVIPKFHLDAYVYAPQIGAYWLWLPHFDLVVFIASCLSLWTPNLYLIPISCVSFLVGSNIFSRFLVGMDFMETLGKGTVFIGITLLATDPSTAPKTKLGQIFYGISYAISMALAFPLLALLKWDQYYKKVMFIWLLNFLAPYYDDIGAWLEKNFLALKSLETNFTQKKLLIFYISFFAIALNFVERTTNPPFVMDWTKEYQERPRVMELVSRETMLLTSEKKTDGFFDRLIFALSNGHAADGSSHYSFALFGEPLFFKTFDSNLRSDLLYPSERFIPPSPYALNANFERSR